MIFPQNNQLIDKITNICGFFVENMILSFEKEQILFRESHFDNNDIFLQNKGNEVNIRYDPIHNNPQRSLGSQILVDPKRLVFSSFLSESYNFFCFKCEKKAKIPEIIWICGDKSKCFVYSNICSKLGYFSSLHKFNANNQGLLLYKGLEKMDISCKDRGFLLILNRIFAGDAISDFQMYLRIILHQREFPPLCSHTRPFFLSMFEHPQLLFSIATALISPSFTEDIIISWLCAAGENIITILPLLLFYISTHQQNGNCLVFHIVNYILSHNYTITHTDSSRFSQFVLFHLKNETKDQYQSLFPSLPNHSPQFPSDISIYVCPHISDDQITVLLNLTLSNIDIIIDHVKSISFTETIDSYKKSHSK